MKRTISKSNKGQSATKKKQNKSKSKSKDEKTGSFEEQNWEPSFIKQESASIASLAIKRWTANNSTASFEES